ncbi:unnamed protein product [Closterium sp. NIES-65]|nr:unnamed protein product [Closterium sp. NIES-65]
MLAPAGATLAKPAVATAGGAASPADVSIKDGVTGVSDTLLAADGSRFLRLSSAFSTSSNGDGASGSSNSSSDGTTRPFGGPGVAQALCELKPAVPTSNASRQAQQQQQSPRQLSLSFFARASLCAEGEGGAEGEAERLLKVLLLAVPLNASAAAAAGEGGAAGGGAGEQVWGEWRVGVPCGASSAMAAAAGEGVGGSRVAAARTVQAAGAESESLTAAAAGEGVGARPGAAAFTVAASTGGGAGAGAKVGVKREGVALEAGTTAIDLASVMPTRTNPSPLKSFTHWPLSSSHPLLTAGSARRNRSSLSLTTLSDLNSAALALHPAPFALLDPATPSSPCRPFSFSTSFTFRISPNAAGLGGEGLAFVMLPSPTLGLPGPSLGYGRLLLPPGSTIGADDSGSIGAVSSQQRSLAVEFDTSSSPEFFDRSDHHVGVNLHGSMLSLTSAPVHPLGIPSLNAGQTLFAIIHYNASSSLLTWLGGNDPVAAAPPPLLFVGFTAATGKGAEQAQAHEVLGWTFQVEEAAEDPLPFWAVDSFSFPYITPATPLLTRGSTRKRFFAADLSVASADAPAQWDPSSPVPHTLSLLTSPSACLTPFIPPHQTPTPARPLQCSPVARVHAPRHLPSGTRLSSCLTPSLSSLPPCRRPFFLTFLCSPYPPSPSDTDPCKGSPVLPCGMGACTKAPAPWDPSVLLPSCKCPFNLPSFQPSHLTGLPSCFPGETWSGVGKVWSAVGKVWSAVGKVWSAVGKRWSGVGKRWSVVGETWSAVGKRWSVVGGVCIPFYPLLSFLSHHLFPLRLIPFLLISACSSFLNPCAPGVCIDVVLVCCSLTPVLFPLPPFSSPPHPSLPLLTRFLHVSPAPRQPMCPGEAYTCRQLASNPCAPGVCIDDIDGTYSCLCPSPYFPFYFYPKVSARCYQLQLIEVRMPTFLSPYGLTCPLILNTYGLTQADFFSQNKGFQRRAPIPVDTLVNITSRAFSQCTAMYTANYGDTCDSLNALFSTQIQPLNPALSCSDGPRPSQLLCVDFNQTWLEQGKTRVPCDLLAQITPTATGATPSPPPPPPLANYTSDGALVTVVQGPQSCQQLWRAFAIASPTRFFQMNPGLSCDSLLPHSPLQGNMMRKVCVAATDSRPRGGRRKGIREDTGRAGGMVIGMVRAELGRQGTGQGREEWGQASGDLGNGQGGSGSKRNAIWEETGGPCNPAHLAHHVALQGAVWKQRVAGDAGIHLEEARGGGDGKRPPQLLAALRALQHSH